MRALQPDRPFFHAPKSHYRPAHLALRHGTLAGRFRDPGQRGLSRIWIEDFPTDEILHDMDLDNPFDVGTIPPFRAESAPLHMPNMIWLYRRPILDYWSDHEEALGTVVAHVLVHEIGHHFGLSDDDMEAIEADAD
jgi:predicted Zn-dependent protease with MMP-like domain